MNILFTQTHSVARINHEQDSIACFEVVFPQIAIAADACHVISCERDTLIYEMEKSLTLNRK